MERPQSLEHGERGRVSTAHNEFNRRSFELCLLRLFRVLFGLYGGVESLPLSSCKYSGYGMSTGFGYLDTVPLFL